MPDYELEPPPRHFRLWLVPCCDDCRDTLKEAMDWAEQISFRSLFDRLMVLKDN